MILIKLLKYKIAHVVNKDLSISLLMMDTLKCIVNQLPVECTGRITFFLQVTCISRSI